MNDTYEGNGLTIAQQLCQELTALSSGVTGKTLVPVSDYLEPAMKEIDAQLTGGGVSGLSTGFETLDVKLSGLHRGQLIIVSAKTSVGKTAFAGCVAEHIARTDPASVLYFSAEMDSTQLVKRMLCREAEVSAFSIDTGHVYNTAAMFNQQLAPAAAKLEGIRMWIDHQTQSINGVASQIRGFALREPVSFVVVDYAQRFRGTRKKGDTREMELASIGRDLRWLAVECDVPIMLLAQVNKDGITRESEALEMDADVVIRLTREPDQTQNTEHAEALVRKQRNGPVGPVPLMFDKSLTKFLNPAGG